MSRANDGPLTCDAEGCGAAPTMECACAWCRIPPSSPYLRFHACDRHVARVVDMHRRACGRATIWEPIVESPGPDATDRDDAAPSPWDGVDFLPDDVAAMVRAAVLGGARIEGCGQRSDGARRNVTLGGAPPSMADALRAAGFVERLPDGGRFGGAPRWHWLEDDPGASDRGDAVRVALTTINATRADLSDLARAVLALANAVRETVGPSEPLRAAIADCEQLIDRLDPPRRGGP